MGAVLEGGWCRFLANAQACWRQGGVLITGCMHFVKCRTINLGNYPSIPHPPALHYLPSLSRVFLIKQALVRLRTHRGRCHWVKSFPSAPDGLTKNMTHLWATLHNRTSGTSVFTASLLLMRIKFQVSFSSCEHTHGHCILLVSVNT